LEELGCNHVVFPVNFSSWLQLDTTINKHNISDNCLSSMLLSSDMHILSAHGKLVLNGFERQ